MTKSEKISQKQLILYVTATLIILALIATIVTVYKIKGSSELDRVRGEALDELLLNEGTYDPRSIMLTDTSRTKAKKLADMMGGILRITPNGEFATITLPEGKTIYDVFSDNKMKEYISEMSIDYQISASDFEETFNFVKNLEWPNYRVTDTDYSKQTYIPYLNIRNTWSRTRGSGVTVAVIDSGIDTDHPAFSGKISEFSYYASEDKIVKDHSLSVIEDEYGHGTAVAGVISSAMNDGKGTVGIAPEADLLVIKADIDPVTGNFRRHSDLIFGIYYAIEQDVNVINMSFGSPSEQNPFAEVIQLAVDSDIICVASAGNDSSSMLTYPAADENVISVGALAENSWELADYSNYGDNSDIVAPGTVYTAKMGGGYEIIKGTSFSSPITAGAIALYLTQNKNAKAEYEYVREALFASCADLGDLGNDWYFGYGALDINALVIEPKGVITFDMLTDEVEEIEMIYVKGHTLQNIPLDVERNYAVFEGWYYGPDCADGDELEIYTTEFTKDITLYANWINEDDGIPYTYTVLDDGTVEINSYTGKRRFLTIPDKIEGRIVSSIGDNAFAEQVRIREIKLPSGLKTIKARAFYGCNLLTGIDIPDGVKLIGEEAFADCPRLKSISFGSASRLETIEDSAFSKSGILFFDIPKNVSHVSGSAFYGATSLKQINVAAGNDHYISADGILMNSAKNILIAYPAALRGEYSLPSDIKEIDQCAFGYSHLSAIDLKNVVSIGKSAFSHSMLKSVAIPDSVISIGEKAFFGCEYLTDVKIGNGIVHIPESAFAYNSSLSKLTIGNNVRYIELQAFTSCTSLSKLDLSANTALVSIENSAFAGCSAISNIKFAENGNLLYIGDMAFKNNISLSGLKLSESLISIGEYAFENSVISGKLTLPRNLAVLGAGAFGDCDLITEFAFSATNENYMTVNGVVYTKDKTELVAYPAGKSDTAYRLPATTLTVGKASFCGADKLTRVTLNSSLKSIEIEAFKNAVALTSINIPDNVTHIGRYAFSGCYKLSGINLSVNSKLDRIGFAAFANTGITSFTIPANVTTVAQNAFSGCTDLRIVTFAKNSKITTISAYMFLGCDYLNIVTFEAGSSLEHIAAHGFEGLSNLRQIDLSNTNIRNIDNFAFRFCTSLEKIVIPEGVTNIGRYAFYQCTKLTDVTIPASIERIGRYAFLGAENASLYFSSDILPFELDENWDHGISGYYTGVTKVGENSKWRYAIVSGGGYSVLEYLGNDKVIDLCNIDIDADGKKDTVVSIGGYAFADSAVTEIKLPDTVTSIQRYAFFRAEKLEKISIPANIEFIGQYAFASSGIKSVTFEKGSKLENIEQYAFSGCKALKSFNIPNSVKKLGTGIFAESGLTSIGFGSMTELPDKAFYRTKLTQVKIPENMTKIGYYAFAEIDTLKNVTFGTKAELMIMGNAFSHCALTEVNIPANIVYLGEFCFTENKNMQSYTVDAGNSHYASVSGILFNKQKTKLIAYPAGRTGSFEVPAYVETVGFGAFEESRLTSVTFAKGINLLTIGNRAFYGSQIKKITIPASVISIDYYAFATCENLEAVIFASDNNLMGVYEGAFLNCRNLTDIVLPDTIAEISDFAFYGCENLKEIPVNDTAKLKGIYDYAFAYTGISGDLVFTDNLIDIGEYAFRGLDLTSVYLPDGRAKDLCIGLGAFMDCNNISEITLPFIGASLDDKEITWLGYIFGAGRHDASSTYVPKSLKAVNILEGTTTLGYGAFYGLKNLETIDIPYSVENLYPMAFTDCPAIHEFRNEIHLYYQDGKENYKWGSASFGKGLSGHIRIPDGVQEIGYATFRSIKGLTEVSIPESVTKIWSSAFEQCYRLNSVKIPSKITEISDWAFGDCLSLENVLLPEGIESIDLYAFKGCSSLCEITIPKSVKTIYRDAFDECTNLKKIINNCGLKFTIGSEENGEIAKHALLIENADGSKAYADGYTNVSYIETSDGWRFSCVNNEYTLTSYSGNADTATLPMNINNKSYKISMRSSPKHLIIPTGITAINDNAFEDCQTLESIELSNTVVSIGEKAFYQCYNLTNVTFVNGLNSIGNSAFAKCIELKEAIIPDSVTVIDPNAFGSCDNLKNAKLPKNLSVIPINLFTYCYSLNSIRIPNSVTKIDDRAFKGCSSLTEIIIPKNVEKMSTTAFAECNSLNAIKVDNQNQHFKSIDGIVYNTDISTIIAFPGNISHVNIPATVTNFSFAGSINLRSITFAPNSQLKAITFNAFENCTSLTSINIPNGVEEIKTKAFMGCVNLTSISIPASVKKIAGNAFEKCSSLTAIPITEGIEELNLSGCTSLRSLTVPNGVKSLRLDDCSGLTNLKIPNGVEEIYLSKCIGLTELNIPNGVTYLNLYGCSNLKKVNLPDSITHMNLYYCQSLTSVTIPKGITYLKGEVFTGCTALTKITLPETLTSTDKLVFGKCNSLYYIINNSNLKLEFGSEDNGKIAYNAKAITDASGKTTYAEGYEGMKYVDTADGWRFMQVGSKYTLIGYIGNAETATLPKDHNGIAYEWAVSSTPKHLIIPEGIPEIPQSAFEDCATLNTVSLPKSLKTIGNLAFNGCNNLEKVSIPNGVVSIGQSAFRYCESLVSVYIPDSVTYIGHYAFSNCESLATIKFPDSVTTLGSNVLENTLFYDNPENWKNGALFCGIHLIGLDENATSVEVEGCIAEDVSPYILQKLTWNDRLNNIGRFTNIETLVLTSMPSGQVVKNSENMLTLKTVVLTKGAQIQNADHFANLTGVRIYVEMDEKDCKWDESFPGWNNGNLVFYGDDCVRSFFKDNDGTILYDLYLTSSEIIVQPYIPRIKMIGNTAYKFIGWDINSDGKPDSVPATSAGNITAVALYETFKHASESHEFGKETIIVPTCTTNGYSARACSVCSYTERFDYQPKLGHEYVKTYSAPTCEEIGGDKYSCKNCIDFYFENEKPAIGHSVSSWKTLKKAVCTQDGERSGICSRCKKTVTEAIPATGHAYTVTSSEAATCIKTGIENYKCSCGQTAKRVTELISHSYSKVSAPKSFIDWLKQQDNSILYGYEGTGGYYYKCTVCNDMMTSASSEPRSSAAATNSACPHAQTKETVSGGLKTVKCTSCNETLSAIYSGNHSESAHKYEATVTPPTCTEKGYTTYICSVCGDTKKDDYTDPTGHKPGAAATCTEDQRCTVCKSIVAQKLGHSYKSTVIEPTETSDGYTEHACTRCSHSYKDGIVPSKAKKGDLNGDGAVDSQDAIYLLYNSLFGNEKYPISQKCDYTKDTNLDSQDAIYLLYNSLFGAEKYPITIED